MITVNLNARDHEEAHVASASFTLPGVSLARVEEVLSGQLAVTAKWAEETEKLIGHVKAYLRWGGEEARMLSTTGLAVEHKGSDLPEGPADAEVGVTVIVFGGDLEDVEDRLEGLASAVAGPFGEWCTFLHECEHEHHHHHDHEHHDHDHEHQHHHDHGQEEACHCHDHDPSCGHEKGR